MATNEILPFAGSATGSDILSQSLYNSDSQRTVGHQAGVARRELINKTLKQTSAISAGLAKFLADYQTTNITDSLTPDQIKAAITASITAMITPYINHVFADDYATLQLAVTAAGAYGHVILPASLITISTTVTLPQGITLEGYGSGSLVMCTNVSVWAFEYLTPVITTATEYQGPKFINFRIKSTLGVRLNNNAVNPPLYNGTATQGYIKSAYFFKMFFEPYSDNVGTAIQATVMFDSVIEQSQFIGTFKYGLDMLGCDLCVIQYNRFQVCYLNCIRERSTYTYGSQNIINGNQFLPIRNGLSTTSHIETSSRHSIIRDNYFEHFLIDGVTNPIFTSINVTEGINGGYPYTFQLTGNRFDITDTANQCWIVFQVNPMVIDVSSNSMISSAKPYVWLITEPTYYYNVFNRRKFLVDKQDYHLWPMVTDFNPIIPAPYAYLFDPSRAGPGTNDVGATMVIRDNAFVIPNSYVIHPFQSVLQDGGRTGFTATVTFIAKANVNNTTLNVMQRNSVTGGAGLNNVGFTITNKKAKYTYLTSTTLADNFEILMIQAGADDILVYSIMVAYG
jgi:hypothetical protein